jgi:hypothetical protein
MFPIRKIIVALSLLLALTYSSQASTFTLLSGGNFSTYTSGSIDWYNGGPYDSDRNSDPLYSSSVTSLNDGEAYGYAAAGFGSLRDDGGINPSSVSTSSNSYTFAIYSRAGAGYGPGPYCIGDGSASSSQFFGVGGTSQDNGNTGVFTLTWSGFMEGWPNGLGMGTSRISDLIVTVNGVQVETIPGLYFNSMHDYYIPFSGSTLINVAIGDIVGITCSNSSSASADMSYDTKTGLQVSLTAQDFNQVPLPPTALLLGTGLLGLVGWRRSRKA